MAAVLIPDSYLQNNLHINFGNIAVSESELDYPDKSYIMMSVTLRSETLKLYAVFVCDNKINNDTIK